jgi:hypothetical protein
LRGATKNIFKLIEQFKKGGKNLKAKKTKKMIIEKKI